MKLVTLDWTTHWTIGLDLTGVFFASLILEKQNLLADKRIKRLD